MLEQVLNGLERFSGRILGYDLTEAEISAFEDRVGRQIPQPLRSLLMEVNGISFESPVHFDGRDVWCLQSLESIESTLSTYGELLPHVLFPFLKTSADELICLNVENGSVYSFSGYADGLGEFCTSLISPSILDFVSAWHEVDPEIRARR